MILRTIVLASGLCGALAAAQFPGYSQQYLQRLGGAVDALSQVVADFDNSAAALGLTRTDALEQMEGSAFIEARRTDMQRSFERHAQLSADLAFLQAHGPFMRAYNITRMSDIEIARGALEAYKPTLPLSRAGAVFAIFGFLSAAGTATLCTRLLRKRPVNRPMAA